ncbi:MAG: hypothetical protein PHS16_01415 [Candidatus Colwellbacteria bacterium]|jgi:hypothetical protein|nr:hypothetical protein [Candidatus Colwellbacteria bacterium]MCK9497414.1 hypothetical protein [Candidatus Colwellbacteria bacterium]MDD3752579.1 hypothetical protein [Candidatus Colwellbacteria bacterium]MDD4818621.1 hypothetical protein [Candidatus Colwellbacteria bacterium]
MEKNPFIRTIYLYLFTLVGLVLMVIGSAGLVNLGLRTFVFTKADEDDRATMKAPMPTYAPISVDEAEKAAEGEAIILTEDEQAAVQRWLSDYADWQSAEESKDYVAARRSREVSQNLAFIIVGLPLYLYHWGLIKKDRIKNEKK